MFTSRWSWLVPIAGAGLTAAGVLGSTPPGFEAIAGVVLGSPRGPIADSAAYALGAAASLALLVLILLAVVCGVLDLVARHTR